MNILQIISSSGMYGAESVILNLSRALNAVGHRSSIGVFANSLNPNLQLHERATQEGIDSIVFPCRGQLDRVAISRIRDVVRQTGADIVHSHGYKADVYAYFALRRCSCSLVATCHNWIDQEFRDFLYGVIDRFALRRFDRVVAVSDEVKKRLLKAGVAEGRIALVKNGIDRQRFSAVASSSTEPDNAKHRSVVVGLVGRLSHEKGVDTFLRAASHVVADYANAEFVVVGEGPDRESLERLIDELKINSKVSLVGRRDDMPSVYRSFDVMVSSSRKEGLPVSILEGMATGLPVVATTVGEVPRLIRGGETGLLVPPDKPLLLARAIAELLVDREYRERLGCAAKTLIEREFSAERMAAGYLRVYEDSMTIHADKAQSKGIME